MPYEQDCLEVFRDGTALIEIAKTMAGPLATDVSSPICWLIEDLREVLYDLKNAYTESRIWDSFTHVGEAMQLVAELMARLKDTET